MKVVAILALLLAVGCAESPTPQSTIAEKPATATKMTIPQPVVTQALTRDMATSTIEAAFGSVTGATTVEAISQESPQSPEAVVLANIDGREMHLHFRRYDTGWRWETTETDIGSQVAARVTIAAFNEQTRKARVASWVKQHEAKYADTAETFWWVMAAPRLTKHELDMATFHERLEMNRNIIPISNRTVAEKTRLLKKLDPKPVDGWGQAILTVPDPAKRTLLISSAGPDGKSGTADDLSCVFIGYKHFDAERSEVLWDYRPNCVIPEGLTELSHRVGGLGDPIVETSQVVK